MIYDVENNFNELLKMKNFILKMGPKKYNWTVRFFSGILEGVIKETGVL